MTTRKSLGETFHDVFLEAWGHERLTPFASLPAHAQAKWDRAGRLFAALLNAEAAEVVGDLLPYATACVGLPRASWPADSVILRGERFVETHASNAST